MTQVQLLRIGKRIALVLSALIVVLGGAYYYAVMPHRPHVPVGSAEDLLFQADTLAWNDRWEEAAPLYRQAESLFRAQGNQTKALYAAVSQIPPNQSVDIPATIWSLTTDLSQPGASDPETRLRILTVRGILQTNQDAAQARTTWEEVEKLARKLRHYELATRAIGEQGIAAFILGDALTAKKQVVLAWTFAKPELDPTARIRYASVYGAGLVAVGRYGEAMTPLNEAIKIAEAHPEVAYPTLAISTKIDALVGLRRYKEALELANDSLSRLKETPFDGEKTQVYLSRGTIEASLGNRSAAIFDMRTALGLADHMHNFRGLTDVGGTLAQTYFDSGQLHEALDAINAAIQANTNIPNELYLAPANLALKARILDKMGDTEGADDFFQKSTTLVDAMLQRASTVGVQRQLLAEMSDIYSAYFASLCRQDHYNDALRVLEKVRGRLEAEALQHHSSQPLHAPTPQEQELTRLNVALINTDDPKKRDALMSAIYQTEISLGPSKLAAISVVHPVSLPQLQRVLSQDQLLIEYVLANPTSYALAISRSGVHAYSLPSRAAIEANAAKYRNEIHAKLTDPTLAQTLFRELLAPIQEYAEKRDLVIVPDGQLHLLPFSALGNKGAYVISSHTVDVVPSSTAFVILNRQSEEKESAEMPYIGVAAWTQNTDSRSPILRAISGPERSEFVPLPQSEAEVETIAYDLPRPNTILLGANATETRFKELSTESTEVIHLALHGYADVDYPDRSALIFAPEVNGPDDGLLQAREIRELHIKAKLVTLSACDTGVGPVGEADVANVVNAFIEAGADSVVSTLWDLEDESTEHLMKVFYSRLALHERKVDALRSAQLDLLNKGLSPYFWAGVQIVGDPSGTIR
jgi:CHAT domain-containing protein